SPPQAWRTACASSPNRTGPKPSKRRAPSAAPSMRSGPAGAADGRDGEAGSPGWAGPAGAGGCAAGGGPAGAVGPPSQPASAAKDRTRTVAHRRMGTPGAAATARSCHAPRERDEHAPSTLATRRGRRRACARRQPVAIVGAASAATVVAGRRNGWLWSRLEPLLQGPGPSGGWCEMLAQARPAGLVVALAVRRLDRLAGRPEHQAGLEHEGHGVGDHVRLRQVGTGGLLEGRRIRT